MNEEYSANAPSTFASETTWICVYKDTLGYYEGVDNLTDICVPTAWLLDVLRKEGEDPTAWFNEYTADNTESIALLAMSEGVILDCSDKKVLSLLSKKRDINKDKKSSLSSQIRSAEEKAKTSGSISDNFNRDSITSR